MKTATTPRAAHSDLAEGLARAPRDVPTRFLYDARGAALFERIVELPEYYQARTERALLAAHADAIVASLAPRALVELGVGSGDKTRWLLDALARLGGPRRALVHDVHAPSAARAAARLDALHPTVAVRACSGDFLRGLPRPPSGPPRLWALLGSTFGNLSVGQGLSLLHRLGAAGTPDDALLLGVDLAHDPVALVRAYDDARGVTAAINRNALAHVNEACGADFDVGAFAHEARFDASRSRIEMRLVATRAMQVRVAALGAQLALARGDWLRTEISEKHTRASLAARASRAGWRLRETIVDPTERYALVVLSPRPLIRRGATGGPPA